jgi:hypothetical protein
LSYSFSVDGNLAQNTGVNVKGRCIQESATKDSENGPVALYRVIAKTSVPARHRLMRWLGPKITELSWTVTVSQNGRNAEPMQKAESAGRGGASSKISTKDSSLVKFGDLTTII